MPREKPPAHSPLRGLLSQVFAGRTLLKRLHVQDAAPPTNGTWKRANQYSTNEPISAQEMSQSVLRKPALSHPHLQPCIPYLLALEAAVAPPTVLFTEWPVGPVGTGGVCHLSLDS